MIKYFLAVLISFSVGMIIAPFIIKLIKRMNARQTILQYVQQHEAKQGIPTMGGSIFILATAFTVLVLDGANNSFCLFAMLVMLSYGILGFLDDFLKVALKRNLGLRSYQKIISQFLIALIASYFAYKNRYVGTAVNIPIFNILIDFKWWYLPFSVFIYIALTNSVNLTDGLDGLSGNVCCVYFAVYFVVAYMEMTNANDLGRTLYAKEISGLLIFIGALIGGLTAFLWHNSFKAKIIMGDMGSMALGGCGAMVAMLTKNPFLILLAGIMFVVSSISVIIQVIIFKLKRKRVFLMAPFHHHMELKGIPEPKIVSYYTIITFIGGVISLIVM